MAVFSIDITNEGGGFIETEIAGENLIPGDLCYLGTDSKYYKTDANTNSKSTTSLRISLANIPINTSGTFLISGKFTKAGLTSGSKYYISETVGLFTDVKPTGIATNIIRYIGTAWSTTVLEFEPDETYVLADGSQVNDILFGGGGGGGDMTKAVYDTDNSGIVDNSEKLGNVLPTNYARTDIVEAFSNTVSGSDGVGVTDFITKQQMDAAVGSAVLTTKGDLFGYTTQDSRIPVGTNTQVLTADSTQASGIKWNSPLYINYTGVSNYISDAPSSLGLSILSSDIINYYDISAANVKKGYVSDLPFIPKVLPLVTTNSFQNLTIDDTNRVYTVGNKLLVNTSTAVVRCEASNTNIGIEGAKALVTKGYGDANYIGTGGGDMTKVVYDTDNNGIVDNSEKLGGVIATNYARTDIAETFSSTISVANATSNAHAVSRIYGDARYLGITAKAADANLLDGINSTSFLRSNVADTQTGGIIFSSGAITLNNNVTCRFGTSGGESEIYSNAANTYWKLKLGNFYIQDGATTRFTFNRTLGDLTASGDMYAGAFYESSDKRLKKSVKNLEIEKTGYRFVEFNWKKSGIKAYGLIAQEVEKISPELVVTKKDGMKSINYTGVFTKEIRSLQKRIEKLEKYIHNHL